ncbi:MAG: nodulation protein NfeD [Verrucomicrobiales bacterium]
MNRRPLWWLLIAAGLLLPLWGQLVDSAGAGAQGQEAEAEAATRAGAERVPAADAGAGAAGTEGAEETESSSGEGEVRETASRLDSMRIREHSFKGKVVVIPVGMHDLIVGARFDFMGRVLERAQAEGALAVILDMDTPGGLAWEAGQLMMDDLTKMTIPTYTFVNSRAISAGAIVALGTDAIYMAPSSAIGAAAVVTGSGGDLQETMQDKMNSILKAQVRSVAKRKGHNPDIAEAFIDKDVEVVIEVGPEDQEKYPMGSKLISKRGELLSFDHEQATEIINGKPVFARGIAKDLEDLLAQEGIEGELVVAEPLGFESFATWVTRFSVLLLALGIAGAYMEMQAPGFGIPGAVSLICFGTFFFGHYVAGKLAGFEIVAVFVLGLLLVAVEILILPGSIVFGLVGALMIFGALLYTMAGNEPGGGSFSIDVDGIGGAVMNLSLGLAGAAIIGGLLVRLLPETRAFNWLMLKSSVPGGGSLDVPLSAIEGEASAAAEASVAVGATGVALTELRPSGKGSFGEHTLDVVSEADFIERGTEIRILSREGAKIVVVAVR